MKNKTREHATHKKAFLAISIVVLLCGLSVIILEKTKTTDFIKMPGSPQKAAEPVKTTSKQPTAQSSFTTNQPRKEVTQSPSNEGTVTQTSIVSTPTGTEEAWTKSSDGTSVVVYSPSKSQILKSGQVLSGSSTANQINFRLIDNVSGVIARGVLPVSDGNFSGTFSFTTKATEGRVDIFTADADGVEANNISIPVRFQ